MDILNSVIALLEKEEVRNYKLFANRSHSSEDRKDINLFEYIRRSGERFNEYKILKKLYGGGSGKNAYHRLRNRVLKDINKSLVSLHWEGNPLIEALNYLILAILFREKQKFEISHYYLRKAEGKTRSLDQVELLDLIYSEYIRLSFQLEGINPEMYIAKRHENQETLRRLREIDNILAVLSYRLRRSQNFALSDSSILEILQKTVNEYSADPDLMKNPRLRFRIYDAVSKILLQERDYLNLQKYCEQTLDEFTKEGLFTRSNHEVKLQMLTYIFNSMIRNGHNQDVLAYAEQFYEAMLAFNKLFFHKYLFFYHSTLANAQAETQPDKALSIISELLEYDSIQKNSYYLLFIFINQAQYHFLLGKPEAALGRLIRVKLEDAFGLSDPALRLRVELFEMALRLDLDQQENLDYRLPQLRQDYEDLFEADEYKNEKGLWEIIVSINQGDQEKKASGMIARFLEEYSSEETEIFFYGEWLREKAKHLD